MTNLERWDAVVADAIEITMRDWIRYGLDPVYIRACSEQAAKRARRDLEAVEASMREIREAADAW